MKTKLLENLQTAIKDQDWVAVARCALVLEQWSMETSILDMENYFDKEQTEFERDNRSRNFGSIIAVGKGSNNE